MHLFVSRNPISTTCGVGCTLFRSWSKQCALSVFFFLPPSVEQNSDSKLCALSHSYSINEIKMVKFLQFFFLFPKPNHDAHGSLKSPVQLINVKEMLKMHMNMSQNGAINHEKNIVSFILEELIVSQWIWAWSTPHLVFFLNDAWSTPCTPLSM